MIMLALALSIRRGLDENDPMVPLSYEGIRSRDYLQGREISGIVAAIIG
jgi:hypothetical protein